MALSQQARVIAIYKSAPLPQRKTMLAMRKNIREILPRAEEVVSYGMPAFKVDGNVVAGILHAKNHVGYYPFSGSVLRMFPKELAKFSTTKSAIHVPIDKPLSKTLLKKLVAARISQCSVKAGTIDLANYERLDRYWKSLEIAAPARRGLVDSNIHKLTDLKKITRVQFLKIHAVGPSATKIIEREMRRHKISFKK
ncbi:MAG: hypothetical protein FGM59_02165 [Candidatus Nanopelagicaceae bacterium]|nr:hypothetical protein [Candidatus Nanopelagicaceae bacterium]